MTRDEALLRLRRHLQFAYVWAPDEMVEALLMAYEALDREGPEHEAGRQASAGLGTDARGATGEGEQW